MMEVGNLRDVTDAIRALKRKFSNRPVVTIAVGYQGCNYAIFVHEASGKLKGQPRTGNHPDGTPKKGNYWDPNGEPKFLEKTARELSPLIAQQIVRRLTNEGMQLEDALVMSGMLIERESNDIVPVDTSFLVQSSFTAVES